MKRCVIALSAAVLSVSPLSAEDGVEQEKSAQASAPYRHWRITAWEIRDRTDNVGELVHKREWLLLPGVYSSTSSLSSLVIVAGSIPESVSII